MAETTSLKDPQTETHAISRGVSLRAVVFGICITTLVNLLPAYSAYIVHSSRMVFAHIPMAVMVVFTLIAWPLNIALGAFKPTWAFHRGEMTVVFCMGWIGAAVPAANFMGLFLGGVAAPFYYATPENQWSEYLLDFLPRWAVPSNAAEQMTWFFEGKPPGADIPWETWAGPLAWWGSFLIALALLSAALVSILRHQWVDRERLPFPLAEAALSLAEEQGAPGQYELVKNRLFWIGVTIPLVIIIWNIAGYFSHLIPPIEIMSRSNRISLGTGFPSIRAKFNFFILGFAFFTNLDILFSLWFFYLLGVVQTGIFDRIGFTIGSSDIWGSSGGAALGWQAMGAFFTFTLVGVWMAREHLKQVWRKAIFKDPSVTDDNELMPYRVAIIGGSLGVAYLFFWLVQSGMTLDVAAIFLIALIIMTIGVSRIVAESGLIYARMPITPQSVTFYFLGIREMEKTSVAALGLSYCTFGLGNTFGASTLAHIAKMGAELKLRTRVLFGATALALVFSLAISALFTLYLGYKHGAYNFNVYTFNAGNVVIYSNVVKKLQAPFDPSGSRMLFFGIGATLAGLCSFLRYRFLWWPLSPIGLTVFPTGVLSNQAFSIFLAWLVKLILLKIGGIRLYRKVRPLFLGLLLGYVAGIGLIFVVDVLFFMGQGHLVHHW